MNDFYWISPVNFVSKYLLDVICYTLQKNSPDLRAGNSGGEFNVREYKEYLGVAPADYRKNITLSPGYTEFKLRTQGNPTIPENLFERMLTAINQPNTRISAWVENGNLFVNHSDIRDKQAEVDQRLKLKQQIIKTKLINEAIEKWQLVFEEAGFHLYCEVNDSGWNLTHTDPELIESLGTATKEWLDKR